jgi:serine/threonine protein kinase
MDAQRWLAIDELFQAAVAVDRSERARVLYERAGTDVELLAEVESLLTAHDRASGFLDSPAFDVARCVSAQNALSIAPGKRIGKYTLRSVIGHGGSGIVYEAEQDEPSRVVALKVLRAAPLADEWTPRLFRREAQALARLQHPAVAAVYEAGLADEGSYYFAMERVEGIPITEYVGRQHLTIRRRLEIFQAVCDAVHYAHQRGVIHRDLKPSNILVTPDGRPKVLDFGLARISDPEGDHTRFTDLGVFQGTLAYASPEQIRSAAPGDVDLRSDVYSLGVVLFEVLTGARPYEIQGLTLPEAARIICEEPPRSLAAAAPALRGDLATIVHKAIEKDAERRYTSAAAFGEEIARYLARQPILAHPPSTTYQLRKLVARHRLPFAIAGAAFALLCGLSVWMAVLFFRARESEFRARESERFAQQRAATADRVKDFMLGVFASQDPDLAQGDQLSATELLARGVARIERELRDEPLIQAELLHSIGDVHQSRGEFAQAASLRERALEIRVRELGEKEEAVAHTRLHLAWTLKDLNRFAEAQAQYEAALPVLEASLGSRHEMVAELLNGLAEVLRDQDPKRAESLHRRALGIRRERLGDDHPDTAQSLMNLGIVLRRQADNAGAEARFRDALPVLLAHYGEDRVIVGNLYNNLGVALIAQGRLDEAEEALGTAQRILGRLYNGRHANLALLAISLGQIQRNRGRFQEAERSFLKALAMQRELVDDVHMGVATALGLLGALRSRELGDPASALPMKREELAICRTLLTPEHPRLGTACCELGWLLSTLGQHEEAVALMREYVCISQAGKGGAITPPEANNLGKVLAAAGHAEEAEPLLRFACAIETAKPSNEILAVDNQTWFGKCLAAQGRWDEAEPWLLSAQARAIHELGRSHEKGGLHAFIAVRQVLAAREALADLCGATGRGEDAEAWRILASESRAAVQAIREGGAVERP